MLFSTQVEFDPSGDEKIGKRVSLEAVYQVCGVQKNPVRFYKLIITANILSTLSLV